MRRNGTPDDDGYDHQAMVDYLAQMQGICTAGAASKHVQASPVARAALADLQESVAAFEKDLAHAEACAKRLAETDARIEAKLRLRDGQRTLGQGTHSPLN